MNFNTELTSLIEFENRYRDSKENTEKTVINLFSSGGISNVKSIEDVEYVDDNIKFVALLKISDMWRAAIEITATPLGKFSAKLKEFLPYSSNTDSRVNALSNIAPMLAYANVYLNSFNSFQENLCLEIYSALSAVYKKNSASFIEKVNEFISAYRNLSSNNRKIFEAILSNKTNIQELYRFVGSIDKIEESQFLDEFVAITKAIIGNNDMVNAFKFRAELSYIDFVDVCLIPNKEYLSYFDLFKFCITYSGVSGDAVNSIRPNLNYSLKTDLDMKDLDMESVSNYFVLISKIVETINLKGQYSEALKEHNINELIKKYNRTIVGNFILKFCTLLELREEIGL